MSMTFGSMAEVSVGAAKIQEAMGEQKMSPMAEQSRISAQGKGKSYMMNEEERLKAIADKTQYEGGVVTKTLAVMNRERSQGISGSDYGFQKEILGAAYSGKGNIVNGLV